MTGASGFIGQAVVAALAGAGVRVRAAYRVRPAEEYAAAEAVEIGAIDGATDWRRTLEGVTRVVHLAGPAHRRAGDAEYRREIVDATAALAAQAEAAGVQRFLYMSSIKAGAEQGGPLRESDEPRPQGPYAAAKLEAERAVLARTALSPVALRPPLVFAPHAKANFALLLKLAASPLPLPLAGIRNQRSLISLQTLVSAVHAALASSEMQGAFYVADRPALSTPQMIALLREGMGRTAGLFNAPVTAFAPRALRETLVADDSAFRAAFAFAPPEDACALLRACGAAWAAR